MPKRIRDLTTENAVRGHFVPADSPTGTTYKVLLGQAGGILVSDSEGFPLDGSGRRIVFSGTNSNGWFLRLSDGTQFCWSLHTNNDFGEVFNGDDGAYKYRTKVWVFPAAFSNVPAVVHSGDVGDYKVEMFSVYDITTTQTKIDVGQYNTSHDVSYFVTSTLAIGRWY